MNQSVKFKFGMFDARDQRLSRGVRRRLLEKRDVTGGFTRLGALALVGRFWSWFGVGSRTDEFENRAASV